MQRCTKFNKNHLTEDSGEDLQPFCMDSLHTIKGQKLRGLHTKPSDKNYEETSLYSKKKCAECANEDYQQVSVL